MQTDVFTRNPVLHGYWYAVAQLSDVAPGPLSVTVLDNPLSQTPQLLEANAFTMLKQAIEVRLASIEWHSDDTVWYDLLAFSRAGHWLIWLGYPCVRRLQRRFALASLAAMVRTVGAPSEYP